jgi:hypothetical protein
MPYIEETKEYIEFLHSNQFLEYLEEIEKYKENFLNKFNNKFIDLDDKFIIKLD